jgi:hypothetical protein
MFEYKHVTLPAGRIPKSVGFDAVLSMELNEFAEQGWRVVSVTRTGIADTLRGVVLERARS